MSQPPGWSTPDPTPDDDEDAAEPGRPPRRPGEGLAAPRGDAPQGAGEPGGPAGGSRPGDDPDLGWSAPTQGTPGWGGPGWGLGGADGAGDGQDRSAPDGEPGWSSPDDAPGGPAPGSGGAAWSAPDQDTDVPPGWEAPGSTAPGQGAPGTPGAAGPGYGAPGYGAPGYGTPGPAAPGWSAPGQGAPPGNPGEPGAPGAPTGWGGYGTPPAQAGGWGAPAPGWGHQPPGWAALRPKPGIIPLRPIGLGEIYDGAFQAIRTNPRTMIGISAVVISVTALISIVPQAAALVSFGNSDLFDPERADEVTAAEAAGTLGGLASSFLLPALVQALATTIVTGLLIFAVSQAVLGRRTGPAELWRRTRRRVWALIGLSFLVVVVPIVASTLLVLPGILVLAIGGASVAGGVLLGLGIVLAIVAYLALFYGFLALAAPALLLEDLSIAAALRRSWRLVRRRFWRVFGITFLTAILVGILAGIISVPFAIVSSFVGFLQENPYESFPVTLLQLLISQIGSVLSGAVLFPLSAAVSALLYIDIRMRTEGLDVELMRASGDPQP
jgi:hypothetical protein